MKRESPIQPVMPPSNFFHSPFRGLPVLALPIVLMLMVACQPPPPSSLGLDIATPTPVQKVPDGKDTVYFLQQMTDLSRWAQYHPTEKTILRSSHSSESPDDKGIFQGKEYILDGVTWYTLLDEQGPGCITRLWMPDSVNGQIRFYFDNEPKPRISMDVQDFFSGWLKKTAPYLILSASDTTCGQVSYLPIPFSKRCTILCSSSDPALQYQINILKLPESETVISFPSESDQCLLDALSETSKFFSTTAVQTYYARKDKQEKSITLKPDEPQMLINLPGPGAIDYFELQMNKMNMEAISNLNIEIYWDGMDIPSVQCTLHQFFCNNDLQQNWNSLPMGHISNATYTFLYSQFYMPFKEKAQIFLKNRNKEPVELSFRYHVDVDSKKILDDPLYLYVRTNQVNFYTGLIYPMIEFEGAGNFIGMSLIAYTESKQNKFLFMEGDDYIFVDGEPEPSWIGTGIDNRFNMDNHLSTTNYLWYPTHGCLGKMDMVKEENNEKIFQTGCNLYRFQVLDSIPFHTSFMMVQEVGDPIQFNTLSPPEPGNQTMLNWVCYWYGKPGTRQSERKERAYYFKISDKDNDKPDPTSPIMLGSSLHIQLPKGNWWVHYAPIWNLNDIQHVTKVVQ